MANPGTVPIPSRSSSRILAYYSETTGCATPDRTDSYSSALSASSKLVGRALIKHELFTVEEGEVEGDGRFNWSLAI